MMKTILKYSLPLFFLFSLFKTEKADAQAVIDLESGLVGTGYNDVRVPGNLGTFFSLKDDLTPDLRVFLRARVSYTIKLRHTLSLLYAPLKITSTNILKNI